MTDWERFRIKVADAIARWQVVEINVQELFLDVIESRDRRWAAVAYHAVVTFKGKLDMLDEILLFRVEPKQTGSDWKKLKNKITKLSSARNKLVHWIFVATYTESDKQNSYRVIPPFSDERKKVAGKQITETDLDDMISTFGHLQHEVSQFRQRIKSELASGGTY